jgi:hypothetical protein
LEWRPSKSFRVYKGEVVYRLSPNTNVREDAIQWIDAILSAIQLQTKNESELINIREKYWKKEDNEINLVDDLKNIDLKTIDVNLRHKNEESKHEKKIVSFSPDLEKSKIDDNPSVTPHIPVNKDDSNNNSNDADADKKLKKPFQIKTKSRGSILVDYSMIYSSVSDVEVGGRQEAKKTIASFEDHEATTKQIITNVFDEVKNENVQHHKNGCNIS